MTDYNIDHSAFMRLRSHSPSLMDDKIITKFSFVANLRNTRRNMKKLKSNPTTRNAEITTVHFASGIKTDRLRFTLYFTGNTQVGFKAVEREINNFMTTVGALFHTKYSTRFLKYRWNPRDGHI